MRIFLITSSKTRSGGARQAYYQAEGLAERGHEVLFFLPQQSALWELPHTATWYALPEDASLWRAMLESFLDKPSSQHIHIPVIVHAFHNKACKLVSWWGLLWRSRALCVSHRGVLNRPHNPFPYLSPGLAAVVPNSHACARALWCCPQRKIHVIPNGIPDERLCPGHTAASMRALLGIAPRTLVFAFVGHDGLIKGGDILLEAFARYQHRLAEDKAGSLPDPENVHLICVGLDPQKWQGQCARLFSARAVTVHLLGAQEDVASYLQIADVFVQPSRSESLPNTLLEALRMGLPVIGSNVGGIPECIQGNGLLVPAENADALAQAMWVMTDAAQRATFAQQSRVLAATYTPEARCRALENLYLQLVAAKKA